MTEAAAAQPDARSFLLQRVQPAMTGLIDAQTGCANAGSIGEAGTSYRHETVTP